MGPLSPLSGLGRRRFAARFDPLAPSPLRWYDDTQGIETTIGVAASVGQTVQRWLDRSGYLDHALQDASAARATLAPDGLTFDGVNDFFSIPALTLNDFSIFFVQATTGDGGLLGAIGNSPQIRMGQSGSNVMSAFDGGNNPMSTTLTSPRTSLSLLEYSRVGTTITFRQNGVVHGTGTLSGVQTFTVLGAFVNGLANQVAGRIRELYVLGADAAADRAGLETYFLNKRAIS